MPIKHAVISGGGTTFFSTLGAVQQLEKNGIWNINEIESIYGTSAGGIAAVVFCLKFNDWTIINDYFIITKITYNSSFLNIIIFIYIFDNIINNIFIHFYYLHIIIYF